MNYYAHTNGDNKSKWQPLISHLENTEKLAAVFGEDAGISDYAAVAGRLHDLGKYSLKFQKRLEGSPLRVDHSTAGAKELIKLFGNSNSSISSTIAHMLAYCIAGHHGGLPDIGSPIDVEGTGTLRSRMKAEIEDYSAFQTEIDPSGIKLPENLPIRPLKKNPSFSLAFMTRMIYSTLVDADFQETETFVQGAKPRGYEKTVQDLYDALLAYTGKFSNQEQPINKVRTQTLKQCIQKGESDPGFFTLTVPTGGGKTVSSMAFALKHAVKNGLKRIIYVIPYTSIIEQNAKVFRDCVGDENVLEQHSNFDWEDAKEKDQTSADERTTSAIGKLRLAAENWDVPVVVTTNVQFFESLFANRSSRCRKIHNMAKSVIIFDEAQMLPREYMTPAMSALWELVRNYRSSVVFCTATQPALQRFFPAGTKFTEITEDPQGLFNFYKRLKINYLGKLTDDQLIENLSQHQQVLCIVNTRKHAKRLFGMLPPGEGNFHLSTLMCPKHREKVLNEIRKRLAEGLPCRVISTQVMEAGIDVDFPVGFRAIAGLDSIIQAGGRVNREMRHQDSVLYVFDPDSEAVKRIPAFIAQGADVARSVLRDYAGDPVSVEAINAYFELLYSLQDADTAFDSQEIMACFRGTTEFDFKTVAERFQLIEDKTKPVIIPYDETAQKLVESLKSAEFPGSLLRKLQRYTVNIYENEYEALNSIVGITLVAETYSVLIKMEENYHEKTGVVIPAEVTGNAGFVSSRERW